jgi:hypothetical protein
LRAEAEFTSGAEAQQSLGSRGFYVVMMGPDQRELLSSDGEVLTRTKDGVEYVLRFGGYARPATGTKEEGAQLNRYVFVTARVHEDSFPPPEYEPLPGQEGQPAQPPPLNESGDPAADASQKDASEDPAGEAESEPQQPASESQDDAGPEDPASTQSATDAGQDASEDQEDSTPEDGEAEGDQEDVSDAEAERDRIIKDNERKRKEYEEKRKKAEDKVRDLNFRFADWYYVISEDVYKRIHLGRADVVKKKEKSEEEKEQEVDEGFNIDSFRKIEEEGLSPSENGG